MDVPDWGYFSHIPVLAAAIQRAPGPILEMGCGHGSTHLINLMAGDFKVRTYDTDYAWLSKFSEPYGRSQRVFWHVKPEVPGVTAAIDEWCRVAADLVDGKFGVIFLDQAPGEARVPVAKILKDSATFIVCHDTEADDPGGGGAYGWKELDHVFDFRTRYERIRPFTTVYSNVKEFSL